MHGGMEAPQSFLPTIEEVDEGGDEESASVCNSGGLMIFQLEVELPESIARDISAEQ